ncbi:type I 3-dehydroquinate dehydratase [Gleimia sp. 6138-11-ORH1]|uniref:type I 3-dehydroquinate dehydratase n=1 Tax=Gleimia sp. 6138-11-ORH1 TaxID=2973937 RepID=UPI002167F9DC|nr:type I 3-dehydroquinate dehydratase [Gleimia sp. 6138-11-ORH1]MCS4484205.1 type I 3-dehydroquinate dehydratase [Gleimia sp. 6138-11-ORH1]
METVILGGAQAAFPVAKPVEIGAGAAKVICSVSGADAAQLVAQLQQIDFTQVDLVEWRVDSLASFADAIISGVSRVVRRESPVPILATFRTTTEGGTGDFAEYYRVLATLISCGVDAIDIEYTHGQAKEIIEKAVVNGVVPVLSKHDQYATGKVETILAELQEMQRFVGETVLKTRLELGNDDPSFVGAGVIKYVSYATAPMDALKLMLASRHFVETMQKLPMITLSMGKAGQVTRVFPATSGSAATFASVNDSFTAVGQLDHKIYQYLPAGL